MKRAPQAQFWTFDLGQARVFGCVPGHPNWTFDDPFFRIRSWRNGLGCRRIPHRFDDLVLRSAAVMDE